jgi:OOP family OmpA-OmpF porin
VDITALADSKEQKAKFERSLRADAPDGVLAVIDISSPRPVITPFTARFLIDETGARFDACTAETPQGHARLLAAAKSMGVDDPSCVVGLGAPSTSWATAVETGMRAVEKLGGGSITFSDADVSLIAVEGTSEATLDRIAGDLEAALPDTFSLHATAPQSKDATTNDEKPEFVVLRSPEGQVQLRGRVADDRNRVATEALAGAAFGSQAVYSAMRIDDSLPRDWSTRVLTSIDVLSLLNQGSVSVTQDQILVRGETGDPTAKAEITRLLASRLGDSQTYNINVKYVRKLDPILNLPTPQNCVEKANQAISSGKIVFAPGSTDVDETADDTLDRVAKALEDCEDMEMEIGGHTDSQGGEGMNQQLSQARANSVLDALLTRRVTGVKFTAKGYGEIEPIADNETEDGRESNRRIAFKLIGDAVADKSSDQNTQSDTSAAPETNEENNEQN